MYEALVKEGHSPSDVMKGINLKPEDVHSPDTRISLSQLMTVYRNAIRLSANPYLAYRIGETVHVSTYGMYGYAILCSPDFRTAADVTIRYHLLATPLASVALTEEMGLASWHFEPSVHVAGDPTLYRFVIEKQVGAHISVMRDIMGRAFVPEAIHLTYARANDFGIDPSDAGCEIRYSQKANQMIFKSEWLDSNATLGNRTTFLHMLDLCNTLLADLTLRAGVAGQIREILLRDIADPPSFEAVARQLGSNARSLRRALERQGLSFRILRDELRGRLALEYLRGTALTTDDIAVALGFSDGAAFRRAFQRWTHKTPSEIRSRQRRAR
ncbi:AraC family transcriptional regulator [Ancylobacter lacus]|uniref:AraC family transcriptional regulator n=1 Tax=Ancylobacter lacus TaxID=2579970 RepID=UPI001BCEFF10|nr:AraC family transcriptional regulator [Ancylobacter lacus]